MLKLLIILLFFSAHAAAADSPLGGGEVGGGNPFDPAGSGAAEPNPFDPRPRCEREIRHIGTINGIKVYVVTDEDCTTYYIRSGD